MAEPAPEVRDLPPVHAYPIDRIREADDNPRIISERAVEVVAASLSRFGWKQPVVVDRGPEDCTKKRPGELLVGHTRYRAAKSLGLTHVPGVSAEDLTEEERKAYRITDNRSGDFTTWDLTALSEQLETLADSFADVLALTEWDAVLAEYNDLAGNTLDLPDNVKHALDGGFVLTVHFSSKEDALAAQGTILSLRGVFDVRHDVV